jgi:hypothetical protein
MSRKEPVNFSSPQSHIIQQYSIYHSTHGNIDSRSSTKPVSSNRSSLKCVFPSRSTEVRPQIGSSSECLVAIVCVYFLNPSCCNTPPSLGLEISLGPGEAKMAEREAQTASWLWAASTGDHIPVINIPSQNRTRCKQKEMQTERQPE